jgi:hypothetical protein
MLILSSELVKAASATQLFAQRGFQAKTVAAVRSHRVVCVVNICELRAKAFQIGFDKDGSLFIHFPYFRHRTGILSSSEIPATGERKADVNIEQGGKVTSHRVKYSHHPDGRAHFSQDGKIFTAIKRQSISLDTQNGHMFTLYIQELHALEVAKRAKDAEGISANRSVIDFQTEPTAEAIKFVGRWLDINKLRVSEPDATVGPRHTIIDPDGVRTDAVLVASPQAHAKHVLAISCVAIPRLGPDPEIFLFHGGFDAPETMTDPKRQAGFLAFLYPLSEAASVREWLGSVDYVPKL